MAIRTELNTFDVVDAIDSGDLILKKNSGTTAVGSSSNVTNFKKDTSRYADELYPYVGTVEGKQYHFDTYGNCKEDNTLSLSRPETTITKTTDTVVTRSDGTAIKGGNITSLNPREQLAMTAMKGILENITDPLDMTEYRMAVVSDLAFKLANAMLNSAADARSKEPETTPEPTNTVSVDGTILSTNEEKILYNISDYLKALSNKAASSTENTLSKQLGLLNTALTSTETNSLIAAIKGSGGDVDFTTLISQLASNSLAGCIKNNKFQIEGGQALAEASTVAGEYSDIGSIIVFHTDKTLRKVTKTKLETGIKSLIDATYIKGIIDAAYIKGIIDSSYVNSAVLTALNNTSSDLYKRVKAIAESITN